MTTTNNNKNNVKSGVKENIFDIKDDLAYIDNADDLDKAIRRLKIVIRAQRANIENDVKNIPTEVIKASVGTVLPFFTKAKIANQTWNIAKMAFSFLNANPFKKSADGENKNQLFEVAKQVGTFAALQGLRNLLQRKKKE